MEYEWVGEHQFTSFLGGRRKFILQYCGLNDDCIHGLEQCRVIGYCLGMVNGQVARERIPRASSTSRK